MPPLRFAPLAHTGEAPPSQPRAVSDTRPVLNIFELRSLRRRRQAHVGRLTLFVPPRPPRTSRAVCRSTRRGHVGSHVASTLLAHCWRVRVRRLRKRHAPPRTSPPCQVGRRIVPECPRRADARAVLAVRLSRNGRAFVRELVAQGTCPLDRLEGTASPDRQTRTEHYGTPRFLTDLVVMGSSYQL